MEFSLPDWAEKELNDENGALLFISKYSFRLPTGTPQLARIKSGFLLKEMFERFAQKINKTLQPDRSLWIYSGSDSTIANTLNSLGLFEVNFFEISLI